MVCLFSLYGSRIEFRTLNLVWFTIHSTDIIHTCGASVARKWLPGMPIRLSCMTRLVVGWCCQTCLDVRLTTNWVYFPRFVETSKQMMSPCSSFWRKQQKLWFCVAGVFFPLRSPRVPTETMIFVQVYGPITCQLWDLSRRIIVNLNLMYFEVPVRQSVKPGT